MPVDQIRIGMNVLIEARERGKLRRGLCREGKNIWVYGGREWITKLMSYDGSAGGPPATAEDNRVAFMGFGIGGDQQNISPLPTALDADYPGYNLQNDADPTITMLERPARIDIQGGSNFYWLRELTWSGSSPEYVTPPPTTAVRYFASFTAGEINTISGTYYPMVPISEIGLFHYGYNDASGEYDTMANVYPTGYPPGPPYPTRPAPLAYHTFLSIPKTTSLELTVRWEVRVGG